MPPPVEAKKAMFQREKARGRSSAVARDGPGPDGAIDYGPPPDRPCGTPRTPHAAARRSSLELARAWSPPRCHYGPDDRGAAVPGTCGDHGFARSSRQTSTALEPTGPQHVAPSTGRHAGTEAVLLRPAAVVGLERTLHEGPPRSSLPNRAADRRYLDRSFDNGWGVETGPA